MNLTAIIPMWNAGQFIREALASIRGQTSPIAEVIVVDDGSTDNGRDIVRGSDWVTLIEKEHTGIADTLNRGLAIAHGDLLVFLDADDRWLPEKTTLQLAALQRDPGLAMVFGHARQFGHGPEGDRVIDVRSGVAKSGGLFRREAFTRIGPFPAGGEHDFIGWMLAARDAGLRYVVLPEILYERRLHDANHGIQCKAEQRRSYLLTAKAVLDRRRAAAQPGGAAGGTTD